MKLTFAPFCIKRLAMASRPMERAIMSAVPRDEEQASTFAPLLRRIWAIESWPWEMASWRMFRWRTAATWYSVLMGAPFSARRDIMESDLSFRAARRGRALWERWSILRLTFLLRRKWTASSLLAVTALQRTFFSTFFSLRTASTLAPLSTKASIKGIEGKRAALQRA